MKSFIIGTCFFATNMLISNPTVASLHGTNLIVNPGAEADVGATNSSTIVPPSGWTVLGDLTALQYGTAVGFPTAASPGPPSRGNNFFAGEPNPNADDVASSGSQTIDVSSESTEIDLGNVTYSLEGYFGGFESQDDTAGLEAIFYDADPLVGGNFLGIEGIGHVNAADRGNVTGLLFRSGNGSVPLGTRFILVELFLLGGNGSYNDGYADNLSFRIDHQASGVIPEPTAFVVWSLLGLTVTGARRRRRHTA